MKFVFGAMGGECWFIFLLLYHTMIFPYHHCTDTMCPVYAHRQNKKCMKFNYTQRGFWIKPTSSNWHDVNRVSAFYVRQVTLIFILWIPIIPLSV